MYKNNLKKYSFNMDEIKLFDSFSGIGALHQALKDLDVPINTVAISEIDIDVIISYAAIHIDNFKELLFECPSTDEMKKWLMDKNIGYDFKKKKSCIPRMRKDKLCNLYKACILTNNLGDISKLDYINIPDFDLFNFSFPCQTISIAGKQEGFKKEDGSITRSGLYIYGMKVIKAKTPKYIMIENVKGLITKKFIDDFYNITKQIEELGYVCHYYKKKDDSPTCLNAKDYGIAHNRERIFIICVRKDVGIQDFKFPKGFDNGLRLKDFLEDDVDEKYYISQEKTEKLLNQLKDKNTLMLDMCQAKREGRPREYINFAPTLSARDYKEPRLIKEIRPCLTPDRLEKRQMGRRFKEDGAPAFTIKTQDRHGILEAHTSDNDNKLNQLGYIGNTNSQGNRVYDMNGISTALVANAGGLAKTGLYLSSENNIIKLFDIPSCILKDNERQRRVYSSKGISPTILSRADSSKFLIVPTYRIRKLTPKECWRLMGFDDEDFQKAQNMGISDSQLYKQAGNSIVVNVLYYIFREVFKQYIVND